MTNFKNFDATKPIHVAVYEPKVLGGAEVDVVDILSFDRDKKDDASWLAETINRGCNEGYGDFSSAMVFDMDFITKNPVYIKAIYGMIFADQISHMPWEIRPDKPIRTTVI